jgi:hypothetical protein
MTTYQLLPLIIETNPTISHFVLRLYKNTLNPFVTKHGDFSYCFIGIEDIGSIEDRIKQYEEQGFMVGLTSMVMTTRGIQSLILLDFSVPQSPEAEQELIEKISTFNQSGDIAYSLDGWLIKTTASYHYLGKYITSESNFRHFLGSSLLFRHKDQQKFVVDDRWLGHQLKRGYGSIRIGHKDAGEYPVVIKEIV